MNQRRNFAFGKWGEDQACNFLRRQGFRIIDRNFHTTQGEIDIVATKAGDFYFIEVKTRRKGELATDLAITSAKRRKFNKTVLRYCFVKNVTQGSFITAWLLVVYNSATKSVSFRLAVFV